MAAPKAISFDCYGTIIDWEGEIQKYFKRFLDKKGVDTIDPKEIQRRWEVIQFDYIQTEYKKYHQVLSDTMGMTCKEYGLSFTKADCEDFAESITTWQPFPDSHDALLELQKYTKITLLTNCDNALVKESIKHIGVEFDDVVTAEMAGMYKPNYGGFKLSQQRLGLEAKDMIHAAFGFKYDIVPGRALGYKTCWVNRQGEPRPLNVWEDFMVGDLRTLAIVVKYMAENDDFLQF